MIKTFVSLTLIFNLGFASQAFAQKGKNESNATAGPRKHLSTIVFAGVAGGVLGLSTLSFYGRPQEKLTHIAIGAAIGIIGGAMYSTFKAATEPKDFYNLREQGPNPELWNLTADYRELGPETTPSAAFTFEF